MIIEHMRCIMFTILRLNIFLFVLAAKSQDKIYSPLLDPDVEIVEKVVSANSYRYMWYPGQLSAHLQVKRMEESQVRCVNVGYPGKFYAPERKAFFKKEVNLRTDTKVSWLSTGSVRIYENNNPVESSNKTILLKKGKRRLLFEVQSADDLPAIAIQFDDRTDTEGWQASLDAAYWNSAETSSVFSSGVESPLEDPETQAVISPKSILPLHNATVEEEEVVIQKNGYILVDFFHLEVGKVVLAAKGEGELATFVGESPEEALNENEKLFEQVAIKPFSLSASEREIVLPERALRYVKVACNEGCEISVIKFNAKIWPVDFEMAFESSDDRINDLWNASVASLHTSTHGFYLDGIKRDYLPWSMDAVMSTIGGDYVFADKQVSLNSLSVALLPLNPQKSDVGIPDYPLHALVGFKQHYLRYGDFSTILAYRDRIEQLLRFYETLQDDRGFISANVGVSWGFVPGWATRRGPDRKGTPAYAQIMLYQNYKIGAYFAEKWDDKKAVRHYQQQATKLKSAIMQHFWDEEQGLFINGYTKNGELDKGISHHAQYWAILAEIFPEKYYDTLFETLPKIAYYKDYVSFEKGYEFLAYAKARRTRDMWTFLSEVFGDWLDQGHTRFPENFSYKKNRNEQLMFYNRPYGLSLCHGANGVPGIVAVLHGIVGFSQSDTQLNHYTLRPDLMDLEWANIEFPVKEGKIRLKLRQNENHEIEIPGNCTVTFVSRNNSIKELTKKGTYTIF